jgi:hypothetical protein
MDKAFSEDTSDAGMQVQKICGLNLPDADLKAKIWSELTDEDSKASLLDSKANMEGFF